MGKSVNFKTIFKIVKTIIFITIIIFSIITAIFTVVSTNATKGNGQSIFGYKLYVVTSDSMSKTDFKSGDVIISKTVDLETIKEGDIITFVSNAIESYGKTVTHKVRKVTCDVNGKRAFETYGTTTGTSDTALATQVMGVYVGKISNLGKVLSYLKTPIGYILCVFTPFFLLIIFQLVNTFKLLKEK